MGDSYEKRAREKRKQQKRRMKAEQRSRLKEEEADESDEAIAARYLDLPEDEDRE